jgi:hypothetical protein
MRLRSTIIAPIAIVALLAASVYAPLFHVHDDDADHAPLVHAHLPEPEVYEDETGVHMEAHHPHASARSIDLLTTIQGPVFHFEATIEAAILDLLEPQPSRGFVAAAPPRAHAPPAIASLPPRSPPV